MATMMSPPLFHSLPRVRLSCPRSPALPVAVIKSGHPEFPRPLPDCRQACFQQCVLRIPPAPGPGFGALDVPRCSPAPRPRAVPVSSAPPPPQPSARLLCGPSFLPPQLSPAQLAIDL